MKTNSKFVSGVRWEPPGQLIVRAPFFSVLMIYVDKEAPDHICAELEFMHVLISQGIEAIDAAEYAQLSENVRHQRVFLEKHLGAWMPAFTDKVIEHARTDYYRHLAAVTRTFVAEDMDGLPDLPAEQIIPVRQEA